ncbi:MAG: S-methyl-5-thioribose-1-phosphate isomerase [Thermodesulfobacteriota bacterium]
MKRHIRYSESEKALFLLDQRHLPTEERWFVCRSVPDLVQAMQKMVIRGAPALGVCAAYGCCLALQGLDEQEQAWKQELAQRLEFLSRARPTAVNLSYVVRRMQDAWLADTELSPEDLYWVWIKMAKEIHAADIAANQTLGRIGAELLPSGARVMTHCNAGALATGGYGTALGVIRAAKSQGKEPQVIANETRPLLQGARLTAYELQQDKIPVTLACDNAAALLMAKGEVDAVLVGADRIAANGDTANKIGTLGLAVLARNYQIPFYVAAPVSTLDAQTSSGEDIPIEQRQEQEVTRLGGRDMAPAGMRAHNFAFDVTSNVFIQAIITEKGLLEPPFEQSIAWALAK